VTRPAAAGPHLDVAARPRDDRVAGQGDDLAAERPDVVVVGSASRDLTTDDPRGWRLGGAVSYSSLALARMGLRVQALMGGDVLVADSHELDLLRGAGVDVRIVRLDRSPVFENVEGPNGRFQTALESGEPIPPDAVPAAARSALTWLLAPVADELPDGWADCPPPNALVGLGWQGLLRDLAPGRDVHRRPPRPSRLLERATIVGVSRDDLPPDTVPELLISWLRPGSTLIVTDGSRGGERLIAADAAPPAHDRYAAVPGILEVDPTGAGDVFMATYLAARRGRAPDDPDAGDLALAAAAASLAVERPGLDGVPTLAELADRLERTAARLPD
jgi:sugar/nucleoside kinase (ribokinase family)